MSQRQLLHNQPGAGLQRCATLWHTTSDGGPVLRSLAHQLHPKETLLRNVKKKERRRSEGCFWLKLAVSIFFFLFFLTPWEVTCNMMFF